MRVFSSLNISASALYVQRKRMDVIARNLANVDTTKTENGGPYQREIVIVKENKPIENFKSVLDETQATITRTHPKHMPNGLFSQKQKTDAGGVEVDRIAKDNSQPRLVYDPNHPDANEDGYVLKPNINVVTEMVDIISATRAYEANLTVVDATKKIVKKSLEI